MLKELFASLFLALIYQAIKYVLYRIIFVYQVALNNWINIIVLLVQQSFIPGILKNKFVLNANCKYKMKLILLMIIRQTMK